MSGMVERPHSLLSQTPLPPLIPYAPLKQTDQSREGISCESQISAIRKSMGWSWILLQMQIRNQDKRASWFSDIRSIWNLSLRSSLISERSSTFSAQTGIDSEARTINPFLVAYQLDFAVLNSCCGVPGKQEICFHRKINQAILFGGDGPELTKSDVLAVNVLGDTAIHVAARWGATFTFLRKLLVQDMCVNATNLRGETFAHVLKFRLCLLAISVDDFFDTLLSLGFQFEIRDATGRTILAAMLASEFFRPETPRECLSGVERLLQPGSFVHTALSTPFHNKGLNIAIGEFLQALPEFLRREEFLGLDICDQGQIDQLLLKAMTSNAHLRNTFDRWFSSQ